jgi:hypothetical protein
MIRFISNPNRTLASSLYIPFPFTRQHLKTICFELAFLTKQAWEKNSITCHDSTMTLISKILFLMFGIEMFFDGFYFICLELG